MVFFAGFDFWQYISKQDGVLVLDPTSHYYMWIEMKLDTSNNSQSREDDNLSDLVKADSHFTVFSFMRSKLH